MNRRRQRLQVVLLFSSVLLAAFAAWFMLWNLVRPYPIEVRENSGWMVTAWLLQGHDPYALNLQPAFYYGYGFVYALVVYPFALIFGPTPQLHRAVSDVAIILNCSALFWGMRVSRIPAPLALCGALLFFSHGAFNDFGCGPNGLGLLLFLLSLVLPYAQDFKWGGLLAGIFLSVVAFYTKAYFVLGGPLLASYLFLFRSKEKGLVAGMIFLALLAASAWLVNTLSPLYFTDTLFAMYNYTQHYLSVGHLLKVGFYYSPMGIGLVLLLAWQFRRSYFGSNRPQGWPFNMNLNLADRKQPLLLPPPLRWVTYLLLACGSVYVFKLGLNGGNFFSYVFHVVTPFLIWRACLVAGVEAADRWEPLAFLQATVLLVAGYFCIPMALAHQHDHAAEWRHAADIAARHHDILNTGAVSFILWAQGKPIYDAGMAENYPFGFTHNPSPLLPAYREKCENFQRMINEKIEHGQFDAVMIFSDRSPVQLIFSRILLSQYYHRVETFPLQTTFEDFQIEVWEPRTPKPRPTVISR